MSKLLAILILLSISCEFPRNNQADLQIEIYDRNIETAKSAVPIGVHIISENVTNDNYQAFYICNFDSFGRVELMENFKFNEDENRTYHTALKRSRMKKLSDISKSGMFGINRNWLPVYQHKSEFYTYAPSDWGNCRKRIITDSTFVIWDMDGPYTLPIQEISKNQNGGFDLSLNQVGQGESTELKLRLSQTSDPRNIWVFEFDYGEGEVIYELYVPIEHASELELIVNHSPYSKATEFEFDKLKIRELLNNR